MRMLIAHVLPDLMSTYGDKGNVVCFAERARWRGIDVRVVAAGRGETVPAAADLIFIGGGQDRCQRLAAPELLAMAPALRQAASEGAVVFGVCGGYQMLGSFYRTADGDIDGLGLLDVWTEAGSDRLIGQTAIRIDLRGASGLVVGFENHAGRTFLGPGARPFGSVLAGAGNNGADGTEGAVQGTVVGTYLHGPVLPRNPQLADLLLRWALVREHGDVELPALDDRAEEDAHRHGLRLARIRVPDATR